MNSSLIMILTIKGAWSNRLLRSDKMEWFLNSLELTQMSYVKSIYLRDMSSQWCCHFNIYKTSLSFVIAPFLVTCPYGSDAIIQISSLLWQCSPIFSYLTLISILLLKPPLRARYWNPEHLLYIWYVYKISSYTIIH